MTQDEIIEMARQANFYYSEYAESYAASIDDLEAFAKLVAEKEREACANICDEANKRFQDLWKRFEYEIDMGAELGTYQCAKAIRARGGNANTM